MEVIKVVSFRKSEGETDHSMESSYFFPDQSLFLKKCQPVFALCASVCLCLWKGNRCWQPIQGLLNQGIELKAEQGELLRVMALGELILPAVCHAPLKPGEDALNLTLHGARGADGRLGR